MANLIKVNGGKSVWPSGYTLKSVEYGDVWPGFVGRLTNWIQ